MPHLRTPTAPGQALARLKATQAVRRAGRASSGRHSGSIRLCQRLRSDMRDRRRVHSDRRRRHRRRRAQQAAHAKQGPSHQGSQTSQTSQPDPSARRHCGGRLRWRVRVIVRGGVCLAVTHETAPGLAADAASTAWGRNCAIDPAGPAGPVALPDCSHAAPGPLALGSGWAAPKPR